MPPQADKIEALIRQVTTLESHTREAERTDNELRDRISRLEERALDHDRQLVRLHEQSTTRAKAIDVWGGRLWTLFVGLICLAAGYYLKR